MARVNRKSSSHKRRIRPMRLRLKRPSGRVLLRFFCLIFLAGIGVAWGAGAFQPLQDKRFQIYQTASQKLGLVVEDIFVEGRKNTPRQDILKVVGVNYQDPILDWDPAQALQGLKRLAWVKTAMVQRRLPSMIYIRLNEREPLAIWQKDRKLHVIDMEGRVIEGAKPEAFRSLLCVVGAGAETHAKTLTRHLAVFPQLQKRVASAVYVGERRWDLILTNRVKIQLPESDFHQALKHLDTLDRQHKLTQKGVMTIDLRLPDRSFFYVTPLGK